MTSTADRRRVVRSLETRRVHDELRGRMFGAEVAPATVGRFVLRRRLGAGASGVVYAAHDPELDREVAVKLVIADADGLAEARALARLSHPNLLGVYEVGRQDGVPFIVSELVEGGNLRGWLAEPRTPAARLAMVVAIGGGIAEAHRRGVVHRDLKPENVLIGGDGRPRVADFGLARGFDASDHGGPLPGTPAYMAPEQRAGEHADPRSDQYSFAVLAYEVLYEVYPSLHDRASGPEPASAAWPALARALAILPEARWPHVDAMVEALAPSIAPPIAPPWSRRTLAVTAGIVVVVAAAVIVVALQRRTPARPPLSPEDNDRARYEEVAGMLRDHDFAGCAARLAGRVRTESGRQLWLQCATEANVLDLVEAACAAWRRDAPASVPPDCDPDVARVRALAAAGESRACAELALTLPASDPMRLLLARCAGAVHAAEGNDADLAFRTCTWMSRANGHPDPEHACGIPPP